MNAQVKQAMDTFVPEIKAGKLTVMGAVFDFRNDYKQGHGRLIITNVNGDTDSHKINAAGILPRK